MTRFDLGRIDYHATQRRSLMHAASPQAKLAALALLVASVVVSTRVEVLGVLAACALFLALASRTPIRDLASLALFPVLLASLLALSQIRGGWTLPALIMLKVLTVSLGTLSVVLCTPYHEIFHLVNHCLPALLADSLLMAYRAFFILLDRAGRVWGTLTLRGGWQAAHPIRSLRNMANVLGLLVVDAADRVQNLYDVMRVRGYRAGTIQRHVWIGWRPWNIPPLGLTSVMLVVALAGEDLLPFTLHPLTAVLLTAGVLLLWLRQEARWNRSSA